MFTKICLENFKSFEHIEFDLSLKKNIYKNFAVIYGENGVGKSNLILSFSVFTELLRTMDVRDMLSNLFENDQDNFLSRLSKEDTQLFQHLTRNLRDMQRIISDYKTIGSTNNIRLQYDFIINKKPGSYLLELSPETNEVVHEKLEYILEKNKSIYFDLTTTSKKFNTKIFTNNEIYSDLKVSTNKFWGKHTFLSILLHEKDDKSENYINTSLSENFKALIHGFTHVSCLVRYGNEERGMLSNIPEVLFNLEQGNLPKHQAPELEKVADSLTKLFNTFNHSILELYYDTKTNDNDSLSYKLFIKKIISGKEKVLDFKLESTGYHQLLRIFPFLLSAINGNVAIIDEIDSGIHDVLIQRIIEDALPYITNGQLIITSHNTMLMEIDAAHESVYILSEDSSFNRQIRCIGDYTKRTYQQNNIRNKYLNHEYEGIPKIDSIDFEPFKVLFNSNDS